MMPENGDWGLEGGQTPIQRPTLPTDKSVGKSFYRQRERAICRNCAVRSGSHLEILKWTDQYHFFKLSFLFCIGV